MRRKLKLIFVNGSGKTTYIKNSIDSLGYDKSEVFFVNKEPMTDEISKKKVGVIEMSNLEKDANLLEGMIYGKVIVERMYEKAKEYEFEFERIYIETPLETKKLVDFLEGKGNHLKYHHEFEIVETKCY